MFKDGWLYSQFERHPFIACLTGSSLVRIASNLFILLGNFTETTTTKVGIFLVLLETSLQVQVLTVAVMYLA